MEPSPDELLEPASSDAAARASDSAEPTKQGSDRRRAGRIENVSPYLIPLLRETPGADGAWDPDGRANDLRPATGILVSAMLGLAIWAAIGLAAWRFLLG